MISGVQKPVASGLVTTCSSVSRAPYLSARSLAHASAESDAGLKSVGTEDVDAPAMAASGSRRNCGATEHRRRCQERVGRTRAR